MKQIKTLPKNAQFQFVDKYGHEIYRTARKKYKVIKIGKDKGIYSYNIYL